MNFNSGIFLIYLPIVVGIYYLLPHRFRKYWVLAASYFFYMYWNPVLILLLITSTVIDYCCSRKMAACKDKPGVRKVMLLISVCMNLGLLFIFKYWGFFGEVANAGAMLLKLPYRVPQLNLILPVGISFYTFQTMSYTIDVYRGDFEAEKDFVSFALYVSFFPQLVAGPIENPRNLLPQLKAEPKPNRDDFYAGFRLLLTGFFRKCVVADLCGIYVNNVFNAPEAANSLAIAVTGALFTIQMYCDFSGYSEIAAGCARLMGIRLVKNFNRPFISQSYGEFFRRWHISLNQWFTHYLYIPLGGSRKGLARTILNTIIVFGLCGLWHGARWTYVLWGLYAAFFICLEILFGKRMYELEEKLSIPRENALVKFIKRMFMFIIFIPAGILFRAESLSKAALMIKRMFTVTPDISAFLEDTGLSYFSIIGLILTLFALKGLYDWADYDLTPAVTETGSARRLVSCALMFTIIALSWLALLSTEDAAGFAYFQF